MPPAPLADFLGDEAAQIAAACTRCGKCVEICPVVPFGPMASVRPQDVVAPVVAFLAEGRPMSEAAGAWTAACNGCGACIPACPEAVNPRKMLMLAAVKESETSSKTPELFRRMSRSIKIMVAMQLVPQEFARLFVPARPREAAMVFYLGCNALRTPHLLFNTMFVLDALDVDYEVVGGPSSCCGVISTKWEGAVSTGQRVTNNTISRFEGFNPDKVLNWCPTCQLHLGETLEGYRKTSFSFEHVTAYLVSRIDDLKRRISRPVARRAVLHIHAGCIDIGRAVEGLLRAVPELDLADTVVESGYTCGGSGCSKSPELAAIEHAALLDRVRETGADTLVTLYHGCHAIFAGAEKQGAFDVLNFTDLLVEAMGGIPHQDMLKRYKLLDDWEMIVNEAQPYLKANGIDVDGDWLKRHGPDIFASAEFKGGPRLSGRRRGKSPPSMRRAAAVAAPVAFAESGPSPKWSLALSGLSAAQRQDVRKYMRTLTLPPRSILFRQGAPSDTLVVLEDGRVRLLQTQRNGEQFAFGVFVGGTVLGLAALILDRPRILTAEAIDPVVISVMQRNDFINCTRTVPGFLDNITRLLALLSVESIGRSGPLALDDAWVRLGNILLSLARNDNRNSCPTIIGLTQEDLAKMVGVSRAWVGTALAKFERLSLISKRRGRITIEHPDRLAVFIAASGS